MYCRRSLIHLVLPTSKVCLLCPIINSEFIKICRLFIAYDANFYSAFAEWLQEVETEVTARPGRSHYFLLIDYYRLVYMYSVVY